MPPSKHGRYTEALRSAEGCVEDSHGGASVERERKRERERRRVAEQRWAPLTPPLAGTVTQHTRSVRSQMVEDSP